MSKFTPTIGLEIHAELKTRTKMFCNSKNDPDETRPNVNICPVCMAHPGTLPVINREAVRHIVRIGTAVGGTIADFTEFDRKSYFYPDIPKGYQISQYEHPLVTGGELALSTSSGQAGIAITRVHLEEDTARSIHSRGKSLVDFNRAGIPLMELVTEPVIHDAGAAGRFARELQLLLRTLGAGEANLEKGEMRIEANVSVSKHEASSSKSETSSKLGTKVEIKNLNSFRSVERAIAHEIARQTAIIEGGGAVGQVVQETRGWDEQKQETFHQRFKEGSADYRYFPEPDLPKLYLSEIPDLAPSAIHASLPELPWDRRARLRARGIPAEAVEILVSDPIYSAVYEREISSIADDKAHNTAVHILVGEVRGKNPTEEQLAHFNNTFRTVMSHYLSGSTSSTGARASIIGVLEKGGEPEIKMQTIDTDVLHRAVEDVLAEHATVAQEYRGGKESALQYLIGQAMKITKGAGNPELLRELIIEQLG